VRLLITGACGFVGATLALALREDMSGVTITGIDNLWRPGSETNRSRLRAAGVRIVHADVRCASDLDALPAADWIIDAAANASVLAGVDGATSSRQIVEHNLLGTVNLLEFCRRHSAGLILLSSSRVYSLTALRSIPLKQEADTLRLALEPTMPGLSARGITEAFATGAPASLYGTTKLASEQLALEYAAAFELPMWINRCGVLAGAGQFGQPAQGIFTWWIHRWRNRQPLVYLGFEGRGLQVRDCLHPADLATLVACQLRERGTGSDQRIVNVAGGLTNAMSLAQLSAWCVNRFGAHHVGSDSGQRAYDVPWVVLDAARASERWGWAPTRPIETILSEIAEHAEAHPNWLATSEG
jgi:CDP-paratose 2-epimerase